MLFRGTGMFMTRGRWAGGGLVIAAGLCALSGCKPSGARPQGGESDSGVTSGAVQVDVRPGVTSSLDTGGGSPTAGPSDAAPDVLTAAVDTHPSTVDAPPLAAPDTATAATLGPLPDIWKQKDLDNATLAGSGRYDRGVFVVQGSGIRAWEQDDDVHFVYLPLAGDGTIEARVVSVENTATYAFAGVMFRNGDAKAAPAAVIRWAMGQGIYWTVRSVANGRWNEASPVYQRKVAFPYWMRLVRNGSTFHAFVSPDGKDWSMELSAVTAQGLSDTMYVGLVVNSQTNKMLNTSVFDHVRVISAKSATPLWEAAAPVIPGETYVNKPGAASGPLCPPGAEEGSGADCSRLCDCLQSRCAGTSDNQMRCKGDPANFCTGFSTATCLTTCKGFTSAQLCCRAGACVQTFHKGELCEQAFTGKGCQ